LLQFLIGPSSYPKQSWQRFISADNAQFVSSDATDLLEKLVRYDHQERLTAKEAQAHIYFSVHLRFIFSDD
jgi:casein kinase II subunit alpha